MFNELTRGCEPYGSITTFNHLPDWNAVSAVPPTDYGYPYGTPTVGYVAPPMDVTVNTASYKHNVQDDTMELVTLNSKGKAKIKKLSNGFNIIKKVENYNDTGEIVFAAVSYNTRTYSGTTIIPGADYVNGKYDKHFESIVRLPGCSKGELNSLIAFQLKVAPCQNQKLFPHQGINEIENGVVCFGGNAGFPKEIEHCVSPGVLRRKGLVNFVSEEVVKANWVRIFGMNPILCYLSNQYLMGLLMYFLNFAGIYINDFLCIKPSNVPRGLTKEKLVPMLSTDNFHRFQLPTLESGGDAIEKAYSEVYDGILLIEDTAFVDEEHQIADGVKAVIRCAQKRGN